MNLALTTDSERFLEVRDDRSEAVPDDRVPMSYRGLIIRPFVATDARKMWLCRLSDSVTGQLEPVKGNGVEEVADAVIERGLFEKAEQAPPAATSSSTTDSEGACRQVTTWRPRIKGERNATQHQRITNE